MQYVQDTHKSPLYAGLGGNRVKNTNQSFDKFSKTPSRHKGSREYHLARVQNPSAVLLVLRC